VYERDPGFLLAHGYLERLRFLRGRPHRAGQPPRYRITPLFGRPVSGRLFETPDAVFTEEMLRPEKQDIVQFAAVWMPLWKPRRG